MGTPILYTDTDAIRASIGLDENDSPDLALVRSNLQLELELELDSWVPTHQDIYNAYSTSAIGSDARRQGINLILFCQWWCAAAVLYRPLAINQVAADGKNRGERFDTDFEALRAYAMGQALRYKEALKSEIEPGYSDPGLPALAAVSVPDLDPITEVPD